MRTRSFLTFNSTVPKNKTPSSINFEQAMQKGNELSVVEIGDKTQPEVTAFAKSPVKESNRTR